MEKLRRQPRKGRLAKAGAREQVAQRQADSMRLRRAGASYREIGDRLGVSAQQAFRDVRVALGESLRLRDGDADSYRQLELSRLDALLVACWPFAAKGSAEHVRAAVRISERRCRLLGIDAPSRTEIGGSFVATHIDRPIGDETTDALLKRMTELRAELERVDADERAARAASAMPDPSPVDDSPEARYERALQQRQRTTH